MASGNPILNALNRVSLVAQIAIGLVFMHTSQKQHQSLAFKQFQIEDV